MQLRVGLTGGIGSGKSSVAEQFAERGAYVVDADRVAREVLAPGSPGSAAIAAAFGTEVLEADGSLNRAELASRAFKNAESKAALDAITHPRISERTRELFAAAPFGVTLVHDVPLLVELGLGPAYDAVVVVDCPDEIRIRRLVARGLSEDDARARMSHQATREDRLAAADFVIDNSGDRAHLAAEVDRVWQSLQALAG